MLFKLNNGDSKAKVADFVFIPLVKDICRLYVSVKVASSVDIDVARAELPNYLNCFIIRDIFPLLQQ